MLKNIFAFAVVFSFILSGLVYAQTAGPAAPPYKMEGGSLVANPDGWGEDCSNWIHYEYPWDSGNLIYDPDLGYYRYCADGSTLDDWPDMFADLYIELDLVVHLDARKVTIHRYGTHSAQTVEFVFGGWLRSNQMNRVSMTHKTNHPMNAMVFQNGVFGGGSDLPITWYTRYGNGLVIGAGDPAWTPRTVGETDDINIDIAKCDHWFQFRAVIELPVHVDDGHYCWQADGCPLPLL